MNASHSDQDHRHPHHLINAERQGTGQQGKMLCARNECDQHDESCRDNKRGDQRRGKKEDKKSVVVVNAGRDEAVHAHANGNKSKRGRQVTFFIMSILILLGEVEI